MCDITTPKPEKRSIPTERWKRLLFGRRLTLFLRIVAGCQLDENGCWVWNHGHSGTGRGGGYGRISVDGQMMAVHRVMFMIIFGPLHSKRHVDHLCRNRICCNPEHLESVTCRQNQKRIPR